MIGKTLSCLMIVILLFAAPTWAQRRQENSPAGVLILAAGCMVGSIYAFSQKAEVTGFLLMFASPVVAVGGMLAISYQTLKRDFH